MTLQYFERIDLAHSHKIDLAIEEQTNTLAQEPKTRRMSTRRLMGRGSCRETPDSKAKGLKAKAWEAYGCERAHAHLAHVMRAALASGCGTRCHAH
jgi:hypothetical protein